MLSAHAFYRRAVERGAQFRFSERVTGIIRRRGTVVGVRTDKGGYATETRHQRRRRVGTAAGAVGGPRRAGRARQPRGRHHRAGGARSSTPMVVDIRPDARVDQLLLLPAQARRHRLLHHARPADCRHRPARDVGVPADDRAPDGRPDAEAGQHQGAPHLARALPDDAGRLAHRSAWSKSVEGYIHAVGMCGQGYMLGPGVGALLSRMVRGAERPTTRPSSTELRPDRAFGGEEALK